MQKQYMAVCVSSAILLSGCAIDSAMQEYDSFVQNHRTQEYLTDGLAGRVVIKERPNSLSLLDEQPYSYNDPRNVIRLHEVFLGQPKSELSAYGLKLKEDKKVVRTQFNGGEKLDCYSNTTTMTDSLKRASKVSESSVLRPNFCGKFFMTEINKSNFPELKYANGDEQQILTAYGMWSLRLSRRISSFDVYKHLDNKGESPAYSYRLTTDFDNKVAAFSITERYPFSFGFIEEFDQNLAKKLASLKDGKGNSVLYKKLTPGEFKRANGTIKTQLMYQLGPNEEYKSGKALEMTAPYFVRIGCDLERKDYCYVNYNQDSITSTTQVSKAIINSGDNKEFIKSYVIGRWKNGEVNPYDVL
ncbi:hypothetical protein [Vibrio vulnificus]|uniref:hypothetical protein n=1 Tax=Vibrio vulnificus TaxID=672 RepID=UPI000B0993B4|nr:hypothetical protein [Vibrio vulnificus]HAS6155161.1 hypothetical protein [Vibrio vulnificus]